MPKLITTLLVPLLLARTALAADLGAPEIATPEASRFFDPTRFLTTAGMRFTGTGDLSLEPEVGLGYHAQERDLPGGALDSIHKVHAQAGGRLSLSDTLYLSAAAKLPLYTYESTGRGIGQDSSSRQSYDVARLSRSALSWTGEIGLHLSTLSDLTLFYDQNPLSGMPGPFQQEERVGTRLILHFN